MSAEEVAQYKRDGFVVARGCSNGGNRPAAPGGEGGPANWTSTSFGRADGEGGRCGCRCGTIPATASTACSRAANRWWTRPRQLLGGEVYHYHSKMIMKDAEGRRRLGLAPGLRLLVSERRPVPAADQRVHRGGPGDARERLPAGDPAARTTGADRPCVDRRSGRRGPGARRRDRSSACRWSTSRWSRATLLFFHCNLLHRSRPEPLRDIRAGR